MSKQIVDVKLNYYYFIVILFCLSRFLALFLTFQIYFNDSTRHMFSAVLKLILIINEIINGIINAIIKPFFEWALSRSNIYFIWVLSLIYIYI